MLPARAKNAKGVESSRQASILSSLCPYEARLHLRTRLIQPQHQPPPERSWIDEGSKKLLLDWGNIIGYQDLFEILYYIPHVKTLSVPRSEVGLITGPWGGGLVRLEHLTKLSISIQFQPSSKLRVGDPNIILRWLCPATIAATCPALRHLELLSPYGEWQAEFTEVPVKIPGKKGHPGPAGKYIESLTTVSRVGGGCVQWNLMTLQQPVFHPSCFHTLHFAGPSPKNMHRLHVAQLSGWNLNVFLHTKGKGIRVLTLDWDTEAISAHRIVLFGPAKHITNLKELTNLTQLTISLQVLYVSVETFQSEVIGQLLLQSHPVAEFNRLFPSSLKVLRIDDYMPTISWLMNLPQTAYLNRIEPLSTTAALFIGKLQRYWLCDRDDREFWLKRDESFMKYYECHGPAVGGPVRAVRRIRDRFIAPDEGHGRKAFVEVLRSNRTVHHRS